MSSRLEECWPWRLVSAMFAECLAHEGVRWLDPVTELPLIDRVHPDHGFAWVDRVPEAQVSIVHEQWQQRIDELPSWREHRWLFPQLTVAEADVLELVAKHSGSAPHLAAVFIGAVTHTLISVAPQSATPASIFLRHASHQMLGTDAPHWRSNQRAVMPFAATLEFFGNYPENDVGCVIDFSARRTAELVSEHRLVRFSVGGS